MADESKNVKISIEDRINTEFSTLVTEEKVDWPGKDFDSDAVTEWIQPDVLGYSSRPTRLSERFELWTLSINCYTVTGPGGETTVRIWELVDLILAAFDQVSLAIKDWTQVPPEPTLFYLRFSEGTVTPIEPPKEAGKFVQQLNVSFEGVLIT